MISFALTILAFLMLVYIGFYAVWFIGIVAMWIYVFLNDVFKEKSIAAKKPVVAQPRKHINLSVKDFNLRLLKFSGIILGCVLLGLVLSFLIYGVSLLFPSQ